MSDLRARLETIARTPVLLVACDFDGTLAPIAGHPSEAQADLGAMTALRELARLPRTHTAVISGRALADLATLTGSPQDVQLIGSHGGEFDDRLAASLAAETLALRDRIATSLALIAARFPGAFLEHKPAGIAFHYRSVAGAMAGDALRAVLEGPAAWPGVHVKHGILVVELGVIAADKGRALRLLRERVGASAVLFAGDDLTDEDALATLATGDIGVKAGPGQTRAEFRVGSTTHVSRLLITLARLRSAWIAGIASTPIERHAVLSDQRTVAMVTPDARIVWLCAPRIDSAALFAELLGGPGDGHLSIAPAAGGSATAQRYAGDSMILQTEFPGFTITDYLDCSGGRPYQRAGRTDLIRAIAGSGRIKVSFAPRLDFGRVGTRLAVREGGVEVQGAADPIVLFAPGISWHIETDGKHQRAIAEFDLPPEGLTLELRCGTSSLRPPLVAESERRLQTHKHWSLWAATLRLPPLEPELVKRSALAIKALCFGPTGAIAAAATTSLPEEIGGVRNWDYRFCWPRDATLAAAALVRLGNTGTAMKLLDWLLGVLDTCQSPDRLRPIYTVTGHDLGPEAEIAELPGYAGSRPVRIGNAAAQQVQLDVFGPIVDLVALMAHRGAALTPEHWRLVQAMVGAVRDRWEDPDHGIWEFRGPVKHHTHTKAMCWQTVDRALGIADIYLGRQPDEWKTLRDAIRDDVLARGWHEESRAFTAAYDLPEVDAAALSVGLSGMVVPNDPRFIATVEAVERTLREGPTVYRYRNADGLPGSEGGFHICAGWLLESYLLIGRRDEALALFNDMVSLAGPTGLLCEQFDPHQRRGLGNHPQAYSHLAIINAAVKLAEAASL
jgi:trehalose 6-phosphate phosphatase